MRIGAALLDGVGGAPEDGAREAFDLATRVVVEAPKLADSVGAPALRLRAIAVSRSHDATMTDALADEMRARQAQAWLDAGDPAKAFDVASAVFASVKMRSAACRAAITRANAAAKARGNHTDGWPDAVTACDKDEQLVDALYFGAKAHASKDPKLAVEWFARVEQLFPAHRFADDARFRAAILVAQSTDEGHDQRAEQMLRTLPDAYPQGDMRTEALFRVALDAMKRGNWSTAVPLLDRITELAPDDRHWAVAGRAEYFRARAAAAAGDSETARATYARVIAKYPLAYYMLLAHARLAADDPALAKRALTEAQSRDSVGTFPAGPLSFAQTPAFSRVIALLEVGDIDAARREVSVAGATSEGAEPEQMWLIGALYNQAGAPDLGHAFARGRVTDIASHYPEGRWRVPWTVAYPRAFEPLVTRSCTATGVSTSLAWAIMREESSFVPDAKSRSNALGLMQLMGPTAKWVAAGTPWQTDEASLKRPDVSIDLGVR
ncbi:MAG TPA: transglycosylase SLT domain-containing protein, partial [Labilithrix sp.]